MTDQKRKELDEKMEALTKVYETAISDLDKDEAIIIATLLEHALKGFQAKRKAIGTQYTVDRSILLKQYGL